ncbi:dinucleotide-binding enzyme [Salinisphaera sp. T31B1]
MIAQVFAALLVLAVGSASAVEPTAATDKPTIAIVGAGSMGQALGRLWAADGYPVIYATRHPDELDAVLERTGHGAKAASVAEAVEQAGVITLAVPYAAEPGLARAHGRAMRGKVLIDVDNAFVHRDGEVAEKAEAMGEALYSAGLFEGTRFVRAFNLVSASRFPAPDGTGHQVFDVPYTTNDDSTRPLAEALIEAAGGRAVYEGGLDNAREY